MTDHASALDLDEAAAGLAGAAVHAHVEGCTACRTRLLQLQTAASEVRADARFRQTLARLPARAAPRRLWLGAAAAALAAAGVLVAVRPGAGMRSKGGASLALIDAAGNRAADPKVGAVVELRISGGSHRFALAAAVEENGRAVPLWPTAGGKSGALGAGGRASVRLQVTPGPVRVVAAFSDAPLLLSDPDWQKPRPGVELRELVVQPAP